MIDLVAYIITKVKDKFLFKAEHKYGLILSQEDSAARPPSLPPKLVKDFSECPDGYTEFAESVCAYLDMLARAAPTFEDFYICLIECLDVARPNTLTVF